MMFTYLHLVKGITILILSNAPVNILIKIKGRKSASYQHPMPPKTTKSHKNGHGAAKLGCLGLAIYVPTTI